MNYCNFVLENYVGCISDDEALWRLLLMADPNKEVVSGYIKSAKIVIAKANREIVGVAVLTKTKSIYELKNIAVLSDYQGKGLAKRLIKKIKQMAKSEGADRLLVSTGNSSLDQLALYQKSGFRITGVMPNYFQNYPEPIYENGIRCIDKIN
ncbi:GNAT family N-acetyltransferase [Aliikangiella sp. IMCC44359]|uniref:GNAT family N-acetyltransferase n=1 Tax=Aliikangiella sp. IMCC44359 TaxID=3459125 RepID=UPI00403A9F9F